MHSALDAIRQATQGTPFEGEVWLVGGAVRDELLGRPEPNDFDLVTERDAGQLAQLLFDRGAARAAPITYPRFGTALVQVEGVDIELATARKESYAPESRKPNVAPATLHDDAQRRDFTVNALMRNLHTGELGDPLGQGLRDLDARILRTPRDPAATFRDDPLRMLRAIRFVHGLGFRPADGLYASIFNERQRLEIVSAERIRDELAKVLRHPSAPDALEDLRTTGLLAVFAPEFEAMKGVEQGGFHHLDVWDHTRLAVRLAGCEDLTLTLATLLHDVGKPATRSIDAKGHTRFFQHERVGAEMAQSFLERLRFGQAEIEPVVLLVRNHMRLQTSGELTDAAARRLIRDLGGELDRLLTLVEADSGALKPGVKAKDVDAIRRRVETVRAATPAASLESPLSGDEIMALTGLSEGPEVGRIKGMLLEKVLEGELAAGDKEGAKAWIRSRP